MIKVQFTEAIAIYLCFSIVLVFIVWMSYNYRERSLLNHPRFLRQCHYCTYIFFYYRESGSVICPRCKSYLNVENADPGDVEQDNNIQTKGK